MMKNQFKSLSVQAAFYMGTIFIWGIHTLCALALPVQPDTVHVAPPTGERETDRASILAALDQVEPGGTIQFAAGEYLVGEVLRIDTPGITLLGHPDATMLRGCEDSAFDEVGRAMVDAWTGERTPAETFPIVYACGLFELTGGHGIIRGLTFEQAWSGLMLGCCERENRLLATEGYPIEDNTFRNVINGIRGSPLASEPSVIRSNRFVNTFHAVAAFGSHMQVLDNKISVPEPARVSALGYPGFAIFLGGGPLHAKANMPNIRCEANVISGNRIEVHPDGIIIGAFPGSDCYDNVIRENTVVADTPSFDRTRPSGRLGWEELSFSLLLVGSPLLNDYLDDPPDSPFIQYARRLTADREFRLQQLEQIEDSLARTFLIGFANDPARQEKVQQYHNEIVLPARNAGRERFQQALSENLRLVSLDISAIEGYEYRDSPELIVPHIRDFIEEIERLEHERRSTNPASTQNHY